MHATYLANRARLLTNATINKLRSKNIDLRPTPLVQVRLDPPIYHKMGMEKAHSKLYDNLCSALQAVHKHSAPESESGLSSELELEVPQCHALLCLWGLIRWDLIPNNDDRIRECIIGIKAYRRVEPMPGSDFRRALAVKGFHAVPLEEHPIFPFDVSCANMDMHIQDWWRRQRENRT